MPGILRSLSGWTSLQGSRPRQLALLAAIIIAGCAVGVLAVAQPRLILTALFFLVITILAGSDRWVAIMMLVWLTPFHGFLAARFALSPAQTLWKEYILILIFIPALIQFLVTKQRVPFHPALVAAVILIIWGLVESFKGQGAMSIIAGLRLSLIYIPLLFIATIHPLEQRRFNLLLAGLFVVGTVIALYALFQFFAGPEQLAALGLPVHERLWARFPQSNGTLSGPEYLGFFMGALMLLYAALMPVVPAGLRPLAMAGIVVMGFANLMTFHRGAWFVTVMGFLFLLLRMRGRKSAYLAVTIAVVVVVLQLAPNLVTDLLGERFRLSFGANDVSFQDRKLLFFNVTVPAIAAHPLGEGIGTIGGAAMSLHRITASPQAAALTESGYLSTARQLGIPGLLIELTLHLLLLATSLRAITRAATPWERSFVTGVAAIQVLFILGGMSDYPGELLPTNILFWLLSGLAVQIDLRGAPA